MKQILIAIFCTGLVFGQVEMPRLDLDGFRTSKTILIEFNRLANESLNAKIQYFDGSLIVKRPIEQTDGITANLPSAGWLIIYMENNGWEFDEIIDLPKKGATQMERMNSKKYLFRQVFME